jgi:hypothetical protein
MRYQAFVSYSRRDARVAKRLHQALERYRVPSGIEWGEANRRLGRFCKDDDEFPVSEHLGAAIEGAIDDSKNLIVIASPDAARSEWVNKEVLRFKRRHTARILAFIVRGRPASGNAATECFPPALRYRVDSDGRITTDPDDPPLAANLAEERFSRAFIRLAAGLLHVTFDALWQRERRRLFRRRALLCASVGLVLLVAILVMAKAVTENDISALRDRSLAVSAEKWRYRGEGSEFDSAFRAALGATILDRPGPGEPWDLNAQSDSTSRALALSGRAVSFRRIFGEYPDTSTRGNYRDDIPNADPSARVAIHAKCAARNVCFSGDSKRLGVAVTDGRVLVYDIVSGVNVYSNHFESVDSLSRIAMDEYGTTVLVGGRKRLYLIDVNRATVRTCPTPDLDHFHEIAALANRWVFAAARGREAVVCEFDPPNCRITRSVQIPEFSPYNSNAFSAGATMFVGYDSWQGLTPVLADFRTETSLKFEKLGSGVGQVKVIAVDGTGDLVALGGNGSGGGRLTAAQLVSLRSGSEASRLAGHTGEIYAVDFMPGANIVVTGGSDFSIRLWDAYKGNELLRLAGHLGDIYDARFSPDGKMLATSSSDGMVLMWDMTALRASGLDSLWQYACKGRRSEWQQPSTVITPEERRTTAPFQGRPWDVLQWRDPSSPLGAVQSVRALFVRWFGWTLFDYAPPVETAANRQ